MFIKNYVKKGRKERRRKKRGREGKKGGRRKRKGERGGREGEGKEKKERERKGKEMLNYWFFVALMKTMFPLLLLVRKRGGEGKEREGGGKGGEKGGKRGGGRETIFH